MVIPQSKAYHAMTVEQTELLLSTDRASGLTQDEATARLLSHGPNLLKQRRARSMASILLHQFNSVIVWLLGAAMILSLSMADHVEALAILLVLIINGVIGFATEYPATRSMEALNRIATVRARVRRGGQEAMVDAKDLVPGDLVVLEAGDVVTADMRLSEVSNLLVDESALTGESMPVEKNANSMPEDSILSDRSCMAFKGTSITNGSAEGIVVATGMDTELGRISSLVESAAVEVPPIEKRLDQLGKRLIGLTFLLACLIAMIGIVRGLDVVLMMQTGVALAVAAVPEGLPIVATLTLARGVLRMARRNALVTRLSSVETLGATTVILTDKTGTITENRMQVSRVLLDGFDPEAGTLQAARTAKLESDVSDRRLERFVEVAVLCNNATLGDGSDERTVGDPMEVALLNFAAQNGVEQKRIETRYPEVREYAFDQQQRMMATVHQDGQQFLFAVKGAPEAVLDCCVSVLDGGGAKPLGPSVRAEWDKKLASTAREGYRLLALAMKHCASPESEPYGGLTLLGVACLLDPIRHEVRDAVHAGRAAGVRIVMLTGDHADTAETTARKAGIGDGALCVIEGRDIAGIDPAQASDQQIERILAADVFARVTPETKFALVKMFQRAGHVVAMTGDGVNDAPALRTADIGVAMGRRGTQVAKEAAHMILRDDAFSTIIHAMRQGRIIFANIRKFVIYLMSCNLSEVLVVGAALGLGLPIPLLPLQILFLNLVTDVFPAFALGLGKGEMRVMDSPPRNPKAGILEKEHWWLMAILGATITTATLAAFSIAHVWLGLGEDEAVTVAFVTLALAQIWNVFNLRSSDADIFVNDVTTNPYVWGAIAICLGLIAGALWVPAVSDVLGIQSPGVPGYSLAFGMSLLPLVGLPIWTAARRFDWI